MLSNWPVSMRMKNECLTKTNQNEYLFFFSSWWLNHKVYPKRRITTITSFIPLILESIISFRRWRWWWWTIYANNGTILTEFVYSSFRNSSSASISISWFCFILREERTFSKLQLTSDGLSFEMWLHQMMIMMMITILWLITGLWVAMEGRKEGLFSSVYCGIVSFNVVLSDKRVKEKKRTILCSSSLTICKMSVCY